MEFVYWEEAQEFTREQYDFLLLRGKRRGMTPIIEKSVSGRNLFVYEVEIEYQIVSRSLQMLYEMNLSGGKAAEPPAVTFGAYIRMFDAPNVEGAFVEASKKFDAFIQGQDAMVKSQVVRRCDLKFVGHVF